jgi:hypothetical protein
MYYREKEIIIHTSHDMIENQMHDSLVSGSCNDADKYNHYIIVDTFGPISWCILSSLDTV